ncbi:SCO-spondin-like [Acanthaster planci]|uniref:SCO-spondin-like n=1 Tax=Acanthaster planci TaxID=133434 RepID=A0A8B8A1Y8_ACAPL|nr:SCO-spondin-like [Acanthaster planci]
MFCRQLTLKATLKLVLLLIGSSGLGLVDGGWTEWTSWSECSVTCGEGGFTTRSRTCLDDGTACHGDYFEGNVCDMDPCPVDGVWWEWSEWTNCTLPCGSGTRFRQRECQEPLHGGMPCQGAYDHTEACNVDPCPVDGNWTQWSDWHACPVSCGGSTQTRNRTCIGPFHGGQPCEGIGSEERECSPEPCPIHGAWSEWADWSECSVTCNYGVIVRQRSCDNPAPQHGGDFCSGRGRETRECYPLTCPRHGGWSLWSPWTECSQSCGWGFRQRQRGCDNPWPAFGGLYCVGSERAGESCMVAPCPVDASWGPWGAWTNCSKACGSGGNHTRTRLCNFPPALHGGRECPGPDWDVGECYVDRCDEDGGWSEWGEWSACSKECETGQETRNRTCDNPPPTPPNGEECRGSGSESRICNTHICPVHGGWSLWSTWTQCPVTCGGDIETRYRLCTEPPPLFSGNDCVGSPNEERACSTNGCPVDGAWTAWSAWADCSISCGGGNTSRSRTCTNPAAVWGGTPCPETDPSQEWQDCNMFPCPIHGGWSAWSDWPDCPVTCGGFELFRDRDCTNPVPQHGGDNCPGDAEETFICNENPCPVNGSWTQWSSWSECSVSCEGGTQSRQRTCADPPPAHGGARCHGNWTEDEVTEQLETEERGCNFQMCPIDGGFTQWTEWPICPVSCGGATIYRHRNCTNPTPKYGGRDCPGHNESQKICNGDIQCPIHGNWGRWLDWAPCSRLCENGTTSRIRLCNNPSPLYGGDRCLGNVQEVAICNTHRCPVHGGFSPWTGWSQCTKSCGGGQTQRTRDCTNPVPSFGGNPCVGPTIEKRLCAAFYCPVHGGFSLWGEWAPCPVTCGGTVVNRTRVCNNPSPRHGGQPCQGPVTSSSLCANNPCPVDGAWTTWSSWSQCSATCGDGREMKRRNCSNPAPAYEGSDCIGEGYREVVCYRSDECPVLPTPPSKLNFSVSVTKAGLVSVYVSWDPAEIDEVATNYLVVQAKRVPTQGVPRGNASAYEWRAFGTVMGVHHVVPVRDNGQTNAGLFEGDFKVRVIAGNQYGEASSEEYSFNVVKYLLGGSVPTAIHISPVAMTAIVIFTHLLCSE